MDRGEQPVYRAYEPSADERLIREFILHLKLGENSIAHFNRKFGVDVLKRFAEPLATLQSWGYLTIDGDAIRLNRDGLLQVDRLLFEFFLPEHQTERYA
jgi:oxygen-independent coproporphyrinogen-3 oxidase